MPPTKNIRFSSNKKSTKRNKVLKSKAIKTNIKGLSRKMVLRGPHAKYGVRTELRMFACRKCDRIWWLYVRSRKPVSKCRKCQLKYDAIPRDQEYGWCKYDCKKCHRGFSGFGSMGNSSKSPCYKCWQPCYPERVIPPRQRRFKKSRFKKSSSTHSCTGHNCCNRVRGPATGRCVHPKSNSRKVKVASKRHVSTGSTLASILTQDDLEPDVSTRMELSDIEEED